ncbi:MAG: hypothetical protein GF317_16195 [Candidatus Lokiarchaeota archaeon]|nr:hypothetical protein [Candidatus Lokiarchaeota archaeon]MBD3201075.1 hypothetical protein [Candidatus Lokiarchaeota archaeon]
MNKRSYYRYLFVLGGIWNITISVSLIILSLAFSEVLPIFSYTPPFSAIWLQITLFLIATFGIGIFLISDNINTKYEIVMIGIIIKIGFFIYSIIYSIYGNIGLVPLLNATIELLISILFIEFLINYKST